MGSPRICSLALCLILELSKGAHPGKYTLVEHSLLLDGVPVQNSTLVPTPVNSQIGLSPGQVMEYVSSPLEWSNESCWCVPTGHIVVLNVSTNIRLKIDLPHTSLETVKAIKNI